MFNVYNDVNDLFLMFLSKCYLVNAFSIDSTDVLKSRQVCNTKTIPKNSILLNPKFDSKNKIENFVKQDAGLHNCFRYVFFQILRKMLFF